MIIAALWIYSAHIFVYKEWWITLGLHFSGRDTTWSILQVVVLKNKNYRIDDMKYNISYSRSSSGVHFQQLTCEFFLPM
jgi:hypothetical protein